MPKISLSPRKLPRQRRSLATVELILVAATRVLSRESLAGFNTNRVAAVAGISVGSLYQYFPNKDALVTALIDRAQSGLAESIQQLLAETRGKSLLESLAAIARVAVEQQYAQPLLAAAIDHEERRLPIQARLAASNQRLVECASMLLSRHRRELASKLPAGAARDILVITKALVEADTVVALKPPEDLEARIVRALHGYLTTAA